MTTFVLVHGAWHGGWCYRAVARKLRAAAHDVYTPTLTGSGERSHLMTGTVNLDTHIRDILNVIAWEDLDRIVLCGHSYGGMVITGVADAIPDKITALVYLDAMVPEKEGDSLWGFASELEHGLFLSTLDADGFGMKPIPAQMFNVVEKERAWVDAKCVPHSFPSFRQGIKLSGKHRQVTRRTYIVAKGWDLAGHPTPFMGFYDRLKTDPAWKTYALSGGHDLMIDQPDEVADILLTAI